MNYSPRYTYYLFKAEADISELPNELANLISQFDKTLEEWLEASEKEQKPYLQALENTDAFISAKIYQLYTEKFTKENLSIEDKLKALKAKASKFKF